MVTFGHCTVINQYNMECICLGEEGKNNESLKFIINKQK